MAMTTIGMLPKDRGGDSRFHRVFFDFDITDDSITTSANDLVPGAIPLNQHRKHVAAAIADRSYVLAQLANIVGPGVTGDPSLVIPALSPATPETGAWLVVKCMAIAILTILIVTLNTTMIWTLLKNRSSLHQDLYNYYNLSIAIADLMVGLLVTPLSIYPAYVGYWVYGNLACKLTSYVQVVVWIVIWCHFMWIGADRYLAIRKPYKYENGGSRKTRYKCWIAFSWLTAALITSPHLYGYKWSKYDRDSALCGLDWRLMTAYSLTVGVLIMVPTFCTLTFTYYSIFRKIGSQYHVQREAMDKRHQLSAVRKASMASSDGCRSLTLKEKLCCWIPWELCSGRVSRQTKQRQFSGRHSSVCPCEPIIVDGSGKPLRKKSNLSIPQSGVRQVVHNTKPVCVKPVLPPLKVPTIISTAGAAGVASKSTTSLSPAGRGALSPKSEAIKGGKKFFASDEATLSANTSFDNSSYTLSFINMVLFMLSWIPWIALKVHSILKGETDSSQIGIGYGLGSASNFKNIPMTQGSPGSNLTAFTYSVKNLYHPTFEFIFCWIVISNSMWKPILYFILDKKFRALVVALFTGKISAAFGKV